MGASKKRGKTASKTGGKGSGGKRSKPIPVEVVSVVQNFAEALAKPLENVQHERFCQHMLREPTVTAAAIKAGYSAVSARSQGSRLLTYVNIQARLAGLLQNTQHRSILRRRDVLRNASQRAQGAIVDVAPLLGLPWDQFSAAIQCHPAGKAIKRVKMGREWNAIEKCWSPPYVRELELFNPRDSERLLADLLGWDAPKRVELGDVRHGGLLVLPGAVAPVIGEMPAAGGGASKG